MAVSFLLALLFFPSLNRKKVWRHLYHRLNDKRRISSYDICLTETMSLLCLLMAAAENSKTNFLRTKGDSRNFTMTAILHLGILFLAKILDNALGTSKTILIQHGRSILAGATLAVSNYIGYRITKQIVTADSNMAMIAVSVASGFGCCLAMAINKKLAKDRLYVNILMSDNKEAMQDLRDYLAQHHITNVAADSYTRNWDTKTITVTAYAQTRAESELINSYISQSQQKIKRVVQK